MRARTSRCRKLFSRAAQVGGLERGSRIAAAQPDQQALHGIEARAPIRPSRSEDVTRLLGRVGPALAAIVIARPGSRPGMRLECMLGRDSWTLSRPRLNLPSASRHDGARPVRLRGAHAVPMTGSGETSELVELLGTDLLALIRARGVPLAKLSAITALPSRSASGRPSPSSSRTVPSSRRVGSRARSARMRWCACGAASARASRPSSRGAATPCSSNGSRAAASPRSTIACDVLRRCGRMLGALHRRPVRDAAERPRRARATSSPSSSGTRSLVLRRKLLDARARAARARRTRTRIARASRRGDHPQGLLRREHRPRTRRTPSSVSTTRRSRTGPHDLDLARTWYRWPMRGPGLVHFTGGYRSSAASRLPSSIFASGQPASWSDRRPRGCVPPRRERWRRSSDCGSSTRRVDRAPLRSDASSPCDSRTAPGRDSSERADLGWLSAFLACGFEEVPDAACDRRVS